MSVCTRYVSKYFYLSPSLTDVSSEGSYRY